jgi:peptidoglycan/LPS O-acetylase OafA/YrhL
MWKYHCMLMNRNFGLDGIRGIAILSVVLFHATMTLGHHWLPARMLLSVTQAGWLGVDIFFALSGFLITGILFKSKAEARGLAHYLRHFYYRRMLRIFPLYFGVLIALLVVPQVISSLRDADYARFVDMQPWFWLHSANIAREVLGWNAPVLEFGRVELTHFWSLAVEEHFYFVWPVLVYFFNRRQLIIAAVAIVILSTTLKLGLLEVSPWLSATPKHLAGLAIGSMAAVAPKLFGRLTFWIGVSLLVLAALWLGVSTQASWLFSPVIALIFSCLCVEVTHSKGTVSKVLSNKLLIMYGKYSYGIYVYHSLFGPWLRDIHLASFPGGYTVGAVVYIMFYLTAPLAIAVVSFRYYEAPFLLLKDKKSSV